MLQELIEELDKGKVRVQESRKEIFGRIDALIGELTTAKQNIEKQLSAEETQQQMTVAAQLNQLPKKGQDTLKRVINTNKTYYENLSKFGKFVAKEFPPKPEYEEPFFKDYIIDKSALNQTIAEHMFRSGFNQAGDTFTKEVIGQLGQEDEEQLVSEEFKAKFKTLNLIVKEMRNGVLSGAKAWAREHTQQLGELGSDLLYAMVKSEFLIMLQQQIDLHLQILNFKGEELSQIHDGGADIKMEDASEQGNQLQDLKKRIDSNYIRLVNFGKQELTRFQDHYTSQVQHLFGSLVQVDDLAQHIHNERNSQLTGTPSKVLKSYLSLIEQGNSLAILEQKFVKDYCRLQGMSQESSLLLITEASTLGMPKLAKSKQFLQGEIVKNCTELPIEIDLGNNFKFHNVFICPVSKDVANQYKDNPPMLLPCGHVISKVSLHRIAKTSPQFLKDGKFKCHTCPTMLALNQAIEIKLQ